MRQVRAVIIIHLHATLLQVALERLRHIINAAARGDAGRAVSRLVAFIAAGAVQRNGMPLRAGGYRAAVLAQPGHVGHGIRALFLGLRGMGGHVHRRDHIVTIVMSNVLIPLRRLANKMRDILPLRVHNAVYRFPFRPGKQRNRQQ